MTYIIDYLLTIAILPLYVVVGACYISTVLLEHVVNIPERIRERNQKLRLKELSPKYIDLETFCNFNTYCFFTFDDVIDNEEITKWYHQYRPHIYKNYEDKLIQVPLLINKYNAELAYVYMDGNTIVIIEDDIEKYKNNQEISI